MKPILSIQSPVSDNLQEIESFGARGGCTETGSWTEPQVEDFVEHAVEAALRHFERGDLDAAEARLLEALSTLERAIDESVSGMRHTLACAMSDVACELGLCFAARGDTRGAAEVLVRCRRAFHDAALDG